MRTILIAAAALLAASVAHAAPAPPPAAPIPQDERARLRDETRSFARQIHLLVNQVSASYVKPVPPEDLYAAAITGLYRAARKPVPRDLRSQVLQAINLAAAIRDRSGPDLLLTSDADPREQLLVRQREAIGGALSGLPALRAAAAGILTKLDEHSALVTLEQQRLTAGLDRYCVGGGLEFTGLAGLGPITIDVVHLGGPAQRVGLRPGDAISHVDGSPIDETPPEKLALLRTGRVTDVPSPLAPPNFDDVPAAEPTPAALELTYRRPGETADRVATLTPSQFRPESVVGVRRTKENRWDFFLDEKEGLAYVRLTSLSKGTSQDLRLALELLREAKVRGVVLDLRWCPGGYLQEAVECAELFLGNAVVTVEKTRNQPDLPYRSAEGDKFLDFPLVVLVNAESVGGAELIASALRDNKRAFVVGQRTRGKGNIQLLLQVGGGLALKLTKGTFHRPSGTKLHRFAEDGPADEWGVVPDEDCRLSPQLSKQLQKWHHQYALRPGPSYERLTLDDPTADAQRLAAVEALRRAVAAKR